MNVSQQDAVRGFAIGQVDGGSIEGAYAHADLPVRQDQVPMGVSHELCPRGVTVTKIAPHSPVRALAHRRVVALPELDLDTDSDGIS